MPNFQTGVDPAPAPGVAKGQGRFYGWVVAVACAVAAASLAEVWFSYGLFVKPLQGEFGWSRSVVSSAASFIVLGYALGAVVSGRLADKYDPRLILLPAAAVAGLSIGLSGQINSIGQLRILCFFAGLAGGPTNTATVATVQRWFRGRRHAATALAIVISGGGVGQLIFSPLINLFILNYGWRKAFLITGIICFVLTLIPSLFIRRSPAMLPAQPGGAGAQPVSIEGWSTTKALATPAYIVLILAMGFGQLAFLALSVHLVPFATDIGISSTVAAAALGLMGGLGTPARMASGVISDKIGWRRALVLSYVGRAVALTWLLFLGQTWMLYGFVFVLASFGGVGNVAQFGILREFFGLRSVGALIGVMSAISGLMGTAAPYLAGFVFDATGKYSLFFGIMAALIFLSGVAVGLVKKPQHMPK